MTTSRNSKQRSANNGYGRIRPIESPIPADRQSAKRHYGVHPYFTRRPHNVVRQYILHYSRPGDTVLDPFGGSGVTAIEAFLENRRGVQNDINPLANFIAQGIADLSNGAVQVYGEALRTLRDICSEKIRALYRMSKPQLEAFASRLKMPEDVVLPKTSDVRHYHELFTFRQIVALAFLRETIDRIHNKPACGAMLLAWSATLAKLNRTFLSAEGRAESRGGSSIFSIYRYKIAKEPVELDPWKTFEERALNVISAKEEIDKIIEHKRRTGGFVGRFQAFSRDVEDLAEEFEGKVDYIFTDPPYGAHISYLDLSTLWNNWLGVTPNLKIRSRELIVGGELELDEETYTKRLGRSIEACIRMLRHGRWLSVVFQHWRVSYFDAILSSAAEAGCNLRAAVPQVGDTIWSMHKKKGNESVLAGELILSFSKADRYDERRPADRNFDVETTISKILHAVPTNTLHGERVFSQLIVEAWNNGAIDSVHISKDDFNELIKQHGWQYDGDHHHWVRREDSQESLFG